MATLTEDMLGMAVNPSTLQTNERVMVITKTGSPVSTGIVQAVYRYGAVQVKEVIDDRSGVGTRIYNSDLYSFVPLLDDDEVANLDNFQDMRNAQSVTETEGVEPPPVQDKPQETPEKKTPEKESETTPFPSAKAKAKKGEEPMDESQVDRVLASVSDAAMQSMRAVGVSPSIIYKKVVEIQAVVLPLLSKPPRG